ncbi:MULTISPECIES: hypothetical protein [unclassified Fischerella]|nr:MULTISPECIES: hypothetical protein [unclassified Fischerella]
MSDPIKRLMWFRWQFDGERVCRTAADCYHYAAHLRHLIGSI